MYYVLIDIGCIECGEETTVIGVFTDKAKAEKLLNKYEKLQAENWHGQHSFQIDEVEIDKVYKPEY